MNLEKLKLIRKDLGEEIGDSLESLGTKELAELIYIANRLSILITRIKNPEKAERLDRLIRGE